MWHRTLSAPSGTFSQVPRAPGVNAASDGGGRTWGLSHASSYMSVACLANTGLRHNRQKYLCIPQTKAHRKTKYTGFTMRLDYGCSKGENYNKTQSQVSFL